MRERERVAFVRPRALPGVELMVARGFFHLWRTFRTEYEIVLMERGGAEWRLGRHRHRSQPGSVYLVTPGDFHLGLDIREPSNFISLLVPASFVTSERPLRFVTSQLDDPHVARVARGAMRAVAHGAPVPMIEESIGELFAAAADLAGERAHSAFGSSPAARVSRMKRWLLQVGSDTASLAEMARAVGLSRYQALREFKRHVGVTPVAYLMRVRLERAADLLRRGQRGSDVAHEVGFSDQSHMIRWFRREMRVTPSRFVSGSLGPATSRIRGRA